MWRGLEIYAKAVHAAEREFKNQWLIWMAVCHGKKDI
jgi:hypothetical protein